MHITSQLRSVEEFHCAKETFKLLMFISIHCALKDFISNILVLNNPCLLFAIIPTESVHPCDILRYF